MSNRDRRAPLEGASTSVLRRPLHAVDHEHLDRRSIGLQLQAELLLQRREERRRVAIRRWWRAGREPQLGPGAVESVPDLVVEVLSPATRANDLGPKRREYIAGGVAELWLVDPAERTVLIVDAAGDHMLSGGQTIRSSRLPGLSLALPDLFA